ncbi:hypothetical protein B0H19DRAFT_1368966 [Mycena capillaripes]|nr:hypothetical protein B0H19DRAFT_1368966 [Mycena capillaripes]
MFSNLLTLGLAALAVVRAAPATGLQSPMAISCNINIPAAGAFTQTKAASFEPGTYNIINVATSTMLRNYGMDTPAFVAYTREFPGPFAEWVVKPAKDGAFTLTNNGLGQRLYVGDDGKMTSGDKKAPMPFAIEPAGEGYFTVKAVNTDWLWTLDNPEAARSEACSTSSFTPLVTTPSHVQHRPDYLLTIYALFTAVYHVVVADSLAGALDPPTGLTTVAPTYAGPSLYRPTVGVARRVAARAVDTTCIHGSSPMVDYALRFFNLLCRGVFSIHSKTV